MPLDRHSLRLIYVRRVIVPLANTLGFRAAMGLARYLARGVFDMNTPGRLRAEQNLQRAYGDTLKPEQRLELARRAFESIAAFWVEAFFVHRKLRVSSWRHCVELEDEPLVRAMADSTRGALVVTGYLGNFAVGAYALAQLCRPLHVVIDEVQHPVLKSWQDELYRQPNLELLASHRARGRLADLLSDGAKVFIVGEHVRARGRTVGVEFLGQPYRCYPTVGLLARWCDVPVYTVSARRLPGPFRFALSAELAADPRDLGSDQDPTEAITQRYMRQLEAQVRRWPGQYLWTRPWEPAAASTDPGAGDKGTQPQPSSTKRVADEGAVKSH